LGNMGGILVRKFARTFLGSGIAVELAEQCVAVFLGPIGQMSNKAFDLLAGGFAEGLGAAEVDGVGLDQVGIELMLADQLAEAVAAVLKRTSVIALAMAMAVHFPAAQ